MKVLSEHSRNLVFYLRIEGLSFIVEERALLRGASIFY